MGTRKTVFLGIFLLACWGLAAQDVVTNSEFDDDVHGWAPISTQTTLTWSGAHDYSGDPTSGSALITHVAELASLTGPVQCVPSTPDDISFDLSGWIRIPSGQPVTGYARLLIRWWTEPNCHGNSTSGLQGPIVTTLDTWTLSSSPSETPPAGTRSAMLYLGVHKDVATTDEFMVHFDHIAFGAESMVFFDGFERGDTAEWSD